MGDRGVISEKRSSLLHLFSFCVLCFVCLYSRFDVLAEASDGAADRNARAVVAADGGESASDRGVSTEDKGGTLKGVVSLKGQKARSPLYIKSDSLSLDSEKRVFVYRGNVEMLRDDIVVTSDLLTGYYSKDNKLETVECEGNVVITRGTELRASSNRAVYDVAGATIVLTEGPELSRNGNTLTADRVVLYVDEDRSEADGNVKMKVIREEDREASKAKLQQSLPVENSEGK